MKFMRPLLLMLLTAFGFFSQGQQINGFAKDDKGVPLNGATVSLVRDSSTIKLSVTKSDGSYDFSGLRQGSYKVVVTHIGYQPAMSTKFSLSSSDVTVPELRLSKVSGNLSNVNVIAKKPM